MSQSVVLWSRFNLSAHIIVFIMRYLIIILQIYYFTDNIKAGEFGVGKDDQ